MEDLKQRKNRLLALSGMVQAVHLAQQIAWHGHANQAEFATCVYSIFQTHAPTVAAVYSEDRKVATGLNILQRILMQSKEKKDLEILNYISGLLILERMLIKNTKMLTSLQRGIDKARAQSLHFSNTHENVIANLAAVYADTISTLNYRIRIQGNPTYLEQQHIVNKIRTALLGGIRSAVLWRQLGGKRLQLVFSKKSLLQDIKLLKEEFVNQEEYA